MSRYDMISFWLKSLIRGCLLCLRLSLAAFISTIWVSSSYEVLKSQKRTIRYLSSSVFLRNVFSSSSWMLGIVNIGGSGGFYYVQTQIINNAKIRKFNFILKYKYLIHFKIQFHLHNIHHHYHYHCYYNCCCPKLSNFKKDSIICLQSGQFKLFFCISYAHS